jgi:hypothetical protein
VPLMLADQDLGHPYASMPAHLTRARQQATLWCGDLSADARVTVVAR